MTVKTYSLKLNGSDKLTPNFTVKEFACKDGSDKTLIDDTLPILLQGIRDHFGQPITNNSAYRTTAHNKAVGGSPASQHLYGAAVDFGWLGMDCLAVAQYAEYLLGNTGGIGLYGTFVHVDVRAIRSRWDQRSGVQVVVSGFPGYQAPEPVAEPTPAETIPVRILCRCGDLLQAVEGQRINGSIYAPVRAVCEALGHNVDWDGNSVTVK